MRKDLTYIVVGCTGYVGNMITKKLLEEGCNIIGLARNEEKINRVFKDKKPTIIYGDIKNIEDLEKLFIGENPFIIFNTVAYVSIGEGDMNELFDVTVGGTKNMIEKANIGESYLFANKPDKINEVLQYISDMTGRKMPPTLPIWTAYLGLRFLWLGAKLTRKRPLYTLASLASLQADTNFTLDKAKKEFGYSPRDLRQTVEAHIKFLQEEGIIRL